MDTIRELAERVAIAESRLKILTYQSAPVKWEDQIKASAHYQIANDAVYKAKQEYWDATSKLTAEQLLELAK